MYIAIDFDGTVVKHRYPKIGEELPNVVNVLKRLLENNHKLILHTMRGGTVLDDAVNWFNERNISLYGVNYNKTQKHWTTSKKIHANLYIDDCALGVPLVIEDNDKYVDWYKIEEWLIENKLLKIKV